MPRPNEIIAAALSARGGVASDEINEATAEVLLHLADYGYEVALTSALDEARADVERLTRIITRDSCDTPSGPHADETGVDTRSEPIANDEQTTDPARRGSNDGAA